MPMPIDAKKSVVENTKFNVCDQVNLESDISSQPSVDDLPDFANASFETLKRLAGLSDADKLIFSD